VVSTIQNFINPADFVSLAGSQMGAARQRELYNREQDLRERAQQEAERHTQYEEQWYNANDQEHRREFDLNLVLNRDELGQRRDEFAQRKTAYSDARGDIEYARGEDKKKQSAYGGLNKLMADFYSRNYGGQQQQQRPQARPPMLMSKDQSQSAGGIGDMSGIDLGQIDPGHFGGMLDKSYGPAIRQQLAEEAPPEKVHIDQADRIIQTMQDRSPDAIKEMAKFIKPTQPQLAKALEIKAATGGIGMPMDEQGVGSWIDAMAGDAETIAPEQRNNMLRVAKMDATNGADWKQSLTPMIADAKTRLQSSRDQIREYAANLRTQSTEAEKAVSNIRTDYRAWKKDNPKPEVRKVGSGVTPADVKADQSAFDDWKEQDEDYRRQLKEQEGLQRQISQEFLQLNARLNKSSSSMLSPTGTQPKTPTPEQKQRIISRAQELANGGMDPKAAAKQAADEWRKGGTR